MGSAAAGKEDKEVEKYSNLSHYRFVPVDIETYDAYGPQGIKLVKQIDKKIRMLLVKNCLLFICSKVYQWQYNEAMRFVLWVAQKILRWPIQFSSTYIVYTYDIQTDV